MEYTDVQRVAFQEAYAKRFRKRFALIVFLFAAMTVLAISDEWADGRSADVLGPIAFVAILVAWWIFESRIWRCPACNQHLGKAFNPKQCRKCGMELRGSSRRSAVR